MPKDPKELATKGTRRAALFARLSGWFFLGSVFASILYHQAGVIADYVSTAFFTLSVLSLFIICPILMIKGNPKGSKNYQTGIGGLAMEIIAITGVITFRHRAKAQSLTP